MKIQHTSFSTLRMSGPTENLLFTIVRLVMMFTATSPTLLKDDRPYRVPLALGLFLLSLVLILLLFTGFLVVVFTGGFFGLVVLVGALGLVVVGLAFALSDFSFLALDSKALTIFSDIVSSTGAWGVSSILVTGSGISVDWSLSLFSPARGVFFFLCEVFLK